jgi:hypothetical protein
MSKAVAILQSNYIPWKGYFDLINLVDEFILLDDVQYTRRDWRNRNRIKSHRGLLWLSIPVLVKGRYDQKVKDTKISDQSWRRAHWGSITHNYGRAPYFRCYRDLFEDLYLGHSDQRLSDVNYRFITAICEMLGITTQIAWSMDYQLAGARTERLVDLCKQTGAGIYVSGPAAKAYLDEDLFRKENIDVRYMHYSDYPEYHQLFPPFEHAVSIVDLVFNEGPSASKYMLSF